MSAPSRDVWRFNEYEVSVGDRGLVFRTDKTTSEIGWRHIVSAEYEKRSGIRIVPLIAGIVMILFDMLFMMQYTDYLFFLIFIVGILLLASSVRRRKCLARIKTTTGDKYELSGDAQQLDGFMVLVRKKVWGK